MPWPEPELELRPESGEEAELGPELGPGRGPVQAQQGARELRAGWRVRKRGLGRELAPRLPSPVVQVEAWVFQAPEEWEGHALRTLSP